MSGGTSPWRRRNSTWTWWEESNFRTRCRMRLQSPRRFQCSWCSNQAQGTSWPSFFPLFLQTCQGSYLSEYRLWWTSFWPWQWSPRPSAEELTATRRGWLPQRVLKQSSMTRGHWWRTWCPPAPTRWWSRWWWGTWASCGEHELLVSLPSSTPSRWQTAPKPCHNLQPYRHTFLNQFWTTRFLSTQSLSPSCTSVWESWESEVSKDIIEKVIKTLTF